MTFTLIPLQMATLDYSLYCHELIFTSSDANHRSIDLFIKQHTEEAERHGGIVLFDHDHLPPLLYVPGGHLFLTTEGIVFRVHKYFFDRDSTWWHQRERELNNLTSDIVLGRDLLSPVHLPGITAKQFLSMLWVIYNPKYGTHSTTKEEWLKIDLAAHLLGFTPLAELAQYKIGIEHARERRRIFHTREDDVILTNKEEIVVDDSDA